MKGCSIQILTLVSDPAAKSFPQTNPNPQSAPPLHGEFDHFTDHSLAKTIDGAIALLWEIKCSHGMDPPGPRFQGPQK
jgi:hypothetical protein